MSRRNRRAKHERPAEQPPAPRIDQIDVMTAEALTLAIGRTWLATFEPACSSVLEARRPDALGHRFTAALTADLMVSAVAKIATTLGIAGEAIGAMRDVLTAWDEARGARGLRTRGRG